MNMPWIPICHCKPPGLGSIQLGAWMGFAECSAAHGSYKSMPLCNSALEQFFCLCYKLRFV